MRDDGRFVSNVECKYPVKKFSVGDGNALVLPQVFKPGLDYEGL
jgi:hypothetical protein